MTLHAYTFDKETGERLTEKDGFPAIGDAIVCEEGVAVVTGWEFTAKHFKLKYKYILKTIEE